MKIKVFLMTVVFMIAAAITCAVSASEGLISENTDYGGDWQVNGTTYVCKERIKWPDFGFYSLGNTSEKLRLYMELTVSDKKSEPDELGGDSGFLVGVTDVNGNGVIEEGSDEYYLIDVASSTDGGFIGIEKNVGKWGDWAAIDRSTGFRAGDKVGLWLIYDPENAHFEIYISDIAEDGSVMTEIEPFLEWTDKSDPLTGAGYGICSKITNSTFTNVTVAHAENATPPTERGYTPLDETASSLMIADFTDPAVVAKMMGTGNDCTLEYDEVEGCMKITVTGGDPFFYLPMNMSKYFNADRYTTVVISYKTEEDCEGEIFYTSTESRTDIQKNHIFYYMDATEDYAELEVNMLEDEYGNWYDQVRSIRIDPDRYGSEDTVFYFRSVSVKTEAEETAEETENETETETETVTETDVTETKTEAGQPTDEEQTDAEQTTAGEDEPGKKSSNTVLAVVMCSVATVLVIAAVVVAIILKKKKNS